MVETRKETSASGKSLKNLHGNERAASPPSGARARSKSPIKQQDTTQQPAMASATATANSGVSGGPWQKFGPPLPMDSGANKSYTAISQGQLNEQAEPLPLTQDSSSINSQSSISVQKSLDSSNSTNSGDNIVDASALVGNVNTSTSDADVLAQRTVDMLTAEKKLAEKKLAEQPLATSKVNVMQDGKLYPNLLVNWDHLSH